MAGPVGRRLPSNDRARNTLCLERRWGTRAYTVGSPATRRRRARQDRARTNVARSLRALTTSASVYLLRACPTHEPRVMRSAPMLGDDRRPRIPRGDGTPSSDVPDRENLAGLSNAALVCRMSFAVRSPV